MELEYHFNRKTILPAMSDEYWLEFQDPSHITKKTISHISILSTPENKPTFKYVHTEIKTSNTTSEFQTWILNSYTTTCTYRKDNYFIAFFFLSFSITCLPEQLDQIWYSDPSTEIKGKSCLPLTISHAHRSTAVPLSIFHSDINRFFWMSITRLSEHIKYTCTKVTREG